MKTEKAISILEALRPSDDENVFAKTIDMAIEALRKQSGTEWIDAREKLPEDGTEVLTTRMHILDGELFVRSETFDELIGWDDIWWAGDPVAWMPLPKPFRTDTKQTGGES